MKHILKPLSLRVLCVDDNHDTADSEAMLLSLYGCRTAVSYDGFAAMSEALRFMPDVCLVDYNMPGMDGCELARRLRAAWRPGRRLVLIAVTAHSSEKMRAMTGEAGFDLHMVKPIDWTEMAGELAEVERTIAEPVVATAAV